MRSPAGVAGPLAALLLAVAGCTEPASDQPLGDVPSAVASSTAGRPSASGSTSGGDQAVRRAIVGDYLRYWDGVLAAHASRNPADATLTRYAAQDALARVANAVRANASLGYQRRGTVTHKPTVTAVTGATARLQDCADVRKWTIYNTRTDRPVPIGASEPRLLTTYDLREQDGRWVVVGATDGGGC